MNRQIKFRAKSIHCDAWCYGNLLWYGEDEIGEIAGFNIWNEKIGKDEEEWTCEKIENFTVGQFTGLYDKNGKEIYEGDILKDKDWELFEDKYSFVVSFDEISPRFLCGRTDGGGSNFQLDATFANRSVIIANIHDNPELLKGGEE